MREPVGMQEQENSKLTTEVKNLKKQVATLSHELKKKYYLTNGQRVGHWLLDKGGVSYLSNWVFTNDIHGVPTIPHQKDKECIIKSWKLPPYFSPYDSKSMKILSRIRSDTNNEWDISWARFIQNMGGNWIHYGTFEFTITMELWNIIVKIDKDTWDEFFMNKNTKDFIDSTVITIPPHYQKYHTYLTEREIEMAMEIKIFEPLNKPDPLDIIQILKFLNIDMKNEIPDYCSIEQIEELWKNILYPKRKNVMTQKEIFGHCKEYGIWSNSTYLGNAIRFLREHKLLKKIGHGYLIDFGYLSDFCEIS